MLGQFENLGFVIMSTRENIRLIARAPFRYIAITHPIKAHILCDRRRVVAVLGCM